MKFDLSRSSFESWPHVYGLLYVKLSELAANNQPIDNAFWALFKWCQPVADMDPEFRQGYKDLIDKVQKDKRRLTDDEKWEIIGLLNQAAFRAKAWTYGDTPEAREPLPSMNGNGHMEANPGTET